MNLQKNKVGKLIQILEKQEVHKFRDFLVSPYLVQKQQQNQLLNLFNCLVTLFEGDDPNITEEKLYQRLFFDRAFVSGKIDKLFSQLTQLLLTFLGLEESFRSLSSERAISKVLLNRGEVGLWKSYHARFEKKIRKMDWLDNSYKHNLLELEFERFAFQQLNPIKITEDSYLSTIDVLDDFYLHHMLDIGVHALSQNKFILPIELGFRFQALPLILNNLKEDKISKSVLILNSTFELLSSSTTIQLEDVKQLIYDLNQVKKEISSILYVYIRSIARNFCIHLYNLGEHQLEAFIFNLYKEDVLNDSFYLNGKIQSAIVYNISTFAIRQKQFDWLNNFLGNLSGKILEQENEDFIIALNKSKMLFFKGNYEGALANLSFDVTDFYFKGTARILEVMTYYELASAQLDHKIEAYKIFVYRIPKSRISPKFIKGHNNFIDILKSIHHPKTKFDLKRIQKIRSKIEQTEVLAEKKWLLEKIEEKARKLR